jgi:tetratricopeptide (TPR) repeat protein
MKHIFQFIVIIIITTSCSHKNNNNLDQIEKNFALGNNEKAQSDLDRLIKEDSTNALNFFTKGNLLAEENNHRDAIDAFSKCIKLQPEYTTAFNNRGYSYLLIGQTEEAVNDFKKAISLAPSFPEAYNNLGLAYKQQGDLLQAILNYKLAISFKPDYADAHYNIANTSLLIGKYKDAINYFEKNNKTGS